MWAEDGMAMRVSARWCSGGQGADSLITQVFYEKEGGPHFMRFLRAEVRRKKRERKRLGRGRHLAQRGSGCGPSHTNETYSFTALNITHFRALGHELFQEPELPVVGFHVFSFHALAQALELQSSGTISGVSLYSSDLEVRVQ